MKKIILMDMDGTLTNSRQLMLPTMENKLNEIFDAGVHIGVLSGSPLKYIKEQMGYWLNQFEYSDKLHIFPCNGTQYVYKANEVYSLDIKEEVADESYMQILSILYGVLSSIQMRFVPIGMPITGTFLKMYLLLACLLYTSPSPRD